MPPRASRRPESYSSSSRSALTSISAMPVCPVSTTVSARYSSAVRPTDAALTRSGRSFETSTTSCPSCDSDRATDRIRVSLSPSRKPAGSTEGSLWLSSTRTVPPSSPTGSGSSRRPCASRMSSSVRSAARAKYPSSGWCRFASSSVMTTIGSTTSCSANRVSAPGSASRTLVSRTYVRRVAADVATRSPSGARPGEPPGKASFPRGDLCTTLRPPGHPRTDTRRQVTRT